MNVHPFLMFEGRCEEAMNFYVSLLPGCEILDIARYGPGAPKEGTVMRARLRVGGQEIGCNDSFVKHAFTFTPAFSLFVDCDAESEFDRIVQGLSDGGQTLMPAGNYGFSKKFAWVNDRFGVSWQINLV